MIWQSRDTCLYYRFILYLYSLYCREPREYVPGYLVLLFWSGCVWTMLLWGESEELGDYTAPLFCVPYGCSCGDVHHAISHCSQWLTESCKCGCGGKYTIVNLTYTAPLLNHSILSLRLESRQKCYIKLYTSYLGLSPAHPHKYCINLCINLPGL